MGINNDPHHRNRCLLVPSNIMNVTINSDASFSNRYQIGTYAFWIVSNLGRIKMSGQLHKLCKDSNEAEIKCILNAIHYVCNDLALLTQSTRIIINTDSLNAIHVLSNDKVNMKRYHLHKKYVHLYTFYLKLKNKLLGKEIYFSHVKAHHDTDTKRSFVNDWLDKSAKQQMGLLIDKHQKEFKHEQQKST